MASTIKGILSTYGFETRTDGSQWWGVGSLVWGYVAEVKSLGGDLYEVKYRSWYYDSWGECLRNEDVKSVLHGALLLQYLFERLPIFSYHQRQERMKKIKIFLKNLLTTKNKGAIIKTSKERGTKNETVYLCSRWNRICRHRGFW